MTFYLAQEIMKPLWQETLSQLEQNLNPQHFATWIKPIQFIGIEKDPDYFKIAEKRINAAYMTKLGITCKTCTSGNPCPVECPLTPIKRPK